MAGCLSGSWPGWPGRAAGPEAARAGGWLAAVYPPLVWTPAYVWSETLFSVLALACVAVLTLDRRRRGLYLAAGALAGLAVLTRPAMLFFLPLAALWLAWKREWRGVVLLSLACAFVIMPWTIRNAREYGRFVLVASEGGITFWTGNHPSAVGEGDLAANPQLKRENVALRARHAGLTPEELEPIYYREARRFIRRAARRVGAADWRARRSTRSCPSARRTGCIPPSTSAPRSSRTLRCCHLR